MPLGLGHRWGLILFCKGGNHGNSSRPHPHFSAWPVPSRRLVCLVCARHGATACASFFTQRHGGCHPAVNRGHPHPTMTIRFVLMVNKQGQTRLAQYYETHKMDERCALESEVIRKCLTRTDTQVRAEPAGRIKTACKEPRIMSATY